MSFATLSEFFYSTFLPIRCQQLGLDEKTRVSYEESVKLWKKLTDDKPLDQITQRDCADFVAALLKHRGKKRGSTMANNSVRKHCTQLHTILKMTGPPRKDNQFGVSLLPNPPFIVGPRAEKKKPKKNWLLDELRTVYSNVHHATKFPNIDGISNEDWWRGLIAVGFYCGFRVDALLKIEWSHINGQWFDLPPSIQKGGSGHRQFIHPEAREHIELLRRPDRPGIFSIPRFASQRRKAYDTLHLLYAKAGIPESKWHFGFHALRATHLSMYARLSTAEGEALRLAQESAGHATINVTLEHYVDADVQEQMRMQVLMRFPSLRGVVAKALETRPAHPTTEIPQRHCHQRNHQQPGHRQERSAERLDEWLL